MTRSIATWIAPLLLGACLMLGCDRTITEERSIEQKRDGTVVKETERVSETPDGGIKKVEEREVSR